jgi:hypothetical protein
VSISLPSPRCPACRSGCVRRSRRRGIVEKTLLTVAFVRPFRCVECGWRFLRPTFRRSFETEQAVFGSRMTPKVAAKAAVGRRETVQLKLNVSQK